MRERIRRLWRQEEGISLHELLIVIVLMGIIIPPALSFIISTQRSQRFVSEATEAQQAARTMMESMTRQLREGGFPQGLSYSEAAVFSSAGDNSVTFYADVDNDGITERIHYQLDTATSSITRTTVEPDCSTSLCSYNHGTTIGPNTALTNVRNGDMSLCGGASGSTTPLFTYWKADRGTGSLTQITATGSTINDLVDINFVKIKLAVDVTASKGPKCQQLTTSASLRNWRG